MLLANVPIAKLKLIAKARRFVVALIRQCVAKLAAIVAAMGVADMNGGQSQADRVLIDASRSAKARTDAIIAEVNAKYQPQWDAIMAKFEKRRWNEGKV